MELTECRLCGKVFIADEQKICPDCMRMLEGLYGSVHEYMRDHRDEDFDMDKLADDMNINPSYIKALVDLGYIEAVIKTGSAEEHGQRQRLAEAFSQELGKMQKNKIVFYGGEIYSRKREK